MPKKNPATPADGEHIFPASQLTPLAIQWKQLNAAGRHKDAMLVLENIVVGSSAMFERLAQFEDFHYTVDLPQLVSAAQEKVIKWLAAWQPKKGKLFSWFSKCAKNAFRSELQKVNQYRRRFHVTSDNLEKFYGVDDHEVDKHDAVQETHNKLRELNCRWGDPQEIGAIRFLIQCIIDDEHDKQDAIRSAAYAYGISFDLSKFFYDWSIVNLRQAFYKQTYVPFTEYDLVLASQSYTYLPDIVDEFGFEVAKKLCVLFGGKRMKFPTIQQLSKIHSDYLLMRDIDKTDLDPDSIAEVARKHKKTVRSAQETYNEMIETIDPRRYGEHSIFNEDSANE
jgi:hypothetical protein